MFLIALICFIIPLFFYFPESKGLSLEEVARLFNDETTTIMLDAPETIGDKMEILKEKQTITQSENVIGTVEK